MMLICIVITDDVSISKRSVLKAIETAFVGQKFDIFCANGEFSYSIHSRKYCEVMRYNITCFAFR
ncbi:ground-like domain protein [Dictyocaulus viviparus]|uniref:Ground-like domain protein n=1 Tax=Dictyocaulus viviparus TaxID=29172 RepID=A0A0D8XQI3_DICVI|nr:ground-like domain protein [Dictyocaulus viviparus]